MSKSHFGKGRKFPVASTTKIQMIETPSKQFRYETYVVAEPPVEKTKKSKKRELEVVEAEEPPKKKEKKKDKKKKKEESSEEEEEVVEKKKEKKGVKKTTKSKVEEPKKRTRVSEAEKLREQTKKFEGVLSSSQRRSSRSSTSSQESKITKQKKTTTKPKQKNAEDSFDDEETPKKIVKQTKQPTKKKVSKPDPVFEETPEIMYDPVEYEAEIPAAPIVTTPVARIVRKPLEVQVPAVQVENPYEFHEKIKSEMTDSERLYELLHTMMKYEIERSKLTNKDFLVSAVKDIASEYLNNVNSIVFQDKSLPNEANEFLRRKEENQLIVLQKLRDEEAKWTQFNAQLTDSKPEPVLETIQVDSIPLDSEYLIKSEVESALRAFPYQIDQIQMCAQEISLMERKGAAFIKKHAKELNKYLKSRNQVEEDDTHHIISSLIK